MNNQGTHVTWTWIVDGKRYVLTNAPRLPQGAFDTLFKDSVKVFDWNEEVEE